MWGKGRQRVKGGGVGMKWGDERESEREGVIDKDIARL